jgi:archaellum component FlaC
MFVKVEGNEFVKNTENNALLTVNASALQQNAARKKLAEKLNGRETEINSIKEQVENLTSDISEIKNMLKQLLK